MKNSIILTKENKENQIIEVTAYHLQDLKVVVKFPELRKLVLIGGQVLDFQELKCCPKLYELDLQLTEVDNFSTLQEIKSVEYLNIAGNYQELMETVQNMSQLKHLALKHCYNLDLLGLRKLTRLTSFSIDDTGEDLGILEVVSMPRLGRLKVFIPREYEQWHLDCFLYSLRLNLPKLEWLELVISAQEFHPKTLHDLKLKHLSVTSKPFYLCEEKED